MYKFYPKIFAQPPGRAAKLLLIMKLNVLLIIFGILQVSASTLAQKITLSEKNAPIETVFEKIRLQSGYDFMITASVLKSARPVNIQVTNADLSAVLNAIFQSQPLEYQLKDNAVLVKIKSPTTFERIKSYFSEIDVTGSIVDPNYVPLSGVYVQIKGTNRGTTTNNNGVFTIKNVEPGSVLVISMMGYEKKEVLADKPVLGNINLVVSTSKLDEVQVIAYGTTTQRTSVGSTSKITSEELSSQMVINPLAALEGRVPGLLVTTGNGAPGAAFKIQIRGQNTLGSVVGSRTPDAPLFIIDGIPFAPQNLSINRLQTFSDANGVGQPGGGISPFDNIDPANIESIEVLKDADATSIYGARGANGVILITTKQGKTGKTQLSGRVFNSINTISRSMPLLNTQQYLQMRKDALSNDGLTANNNPGTPGFAPDLLIFDQNRYSNYLNEFFGESSATQNASVALSGGDFLNTYYVGLNYGRQTYLFPGGFSTNRADGVMKLHHNSLNRKFSVDLSAGYAYSLNNAPGSPSTVSSYTLAPNFPDLRNADGSMRWDINGVNLLSYISSGVNPLAYQLMKNRVAAASFNTSMLLSYEMLPGLKFKTNLGYNNFITNEYLITPKDAQNPLFSPQSTASKSISNAYVWNIEPQLSYDKQIGRNRLSFLVGGTLQQQDNNNVSLSATNFSNDLLINSIASAATVTVQNSNSPYKYNAGFARATYNYDSRYLLSLNGRIDGSSRFAPGKQWGKFGSVGAGWVISQEKFFKDLLDYVSFAKLRASYGTTGNDNVGNYQYTSNWSQVAAGYLYNGQLGYTPKNLANPDFSWSTTKKLEGGLELAFLKDRLVFTGSWYRNRSSNQLIGYQLPMQTGFSTVVQNFPAVVQNTGWEFALSGNMIKGKALNWRSAFNITIPKNKLVAFPGIESTPYANYLIVGQPVSILRGYKYAGINPATGVYQFETASGAVTSAPLAVNRDNMFNIGSQDPKLYGGFRNTFDYKGFQFDIFLEYRKQKGYNYMREQNNPTGYMNNVPMDALNTWNSAGDNAQYQRLTTQSFGTAVTNAFIYYKMSDAVLTDASYIRLKTVSLSYNFKPALLEKMHISGFRAYVNAQNLYTITKYKGNDPETQIFYGIPPLRNISLGLDFNF